jgi:hypothetical protein
MEPFILGAILGSLTIDGLSLADTFYDSKGQPAVPYSSIQ